MRWLKEAFSEERQRLAWQQVQAQGKWRYILTWWVGRWAPFMAVIITLFQTGWDRFVGGEFDGAALAGQFGLSLVMSSVVGVVVGLLVWRNSEARYNGPNDQAGTEEPEAADAGQRGE